MEQKNQTENKEYQFIREKVVSRRRNRIKKMALSVAFTVFLAVIFGIVARAVFLYADGPLKRFLGVGEDPTPTPARRPTPTLRPVRPSEDTTPTAGAAPSGGITPAGDATPSGSGTPTAGLTPSASVTPAGDVTPSADIIPPENVTPPIEGTPSAKATPSVDVTPPTEGIPSTDATPSAGATPVPSITPPAGSVTPTPPLPEQTGEPSQAPSFAEQYAALFAGMQEVAHTVEQSLVTITVTASGIDWLDNPYETQSQTTGIVIGKNDSELLVLTNLDRIQSASRISLTVNKEDYEAGLWSYDQDYNIAVVSVAAEKLPEYFFTNVQVAVFGESTQLTVGTPILALGNPNGYIGSREFGMVTSHESIYYITDGSVDLFNTSTTDSANGDGVIANLSGEIIGIITRTMKSGLDESMCTAVGITKLKNVIERLAAGEGRVYFGIRGEDMPKSALEKQGLDNGIYVTEVENDSPAFEAGIKTGDIITKVDNNFIYTFGGFDALLNLRSPGMEMKVTLWRTVRMKAEEMEMTVVLGERK